MPTKGHHVTTNHSAAMAVQTGSAMSQPLYFAARPFCRLADQQKAEHEGAQGNESEETGKGDDGVEGNEHNCSGKGCEGTNGTGYRGNWNGYENFLLYQLSDMRKEQIAENRRLYEQTLGLEKDIQTLRHDTNAKIQGIEALVNKAAIRVLAALIVLLVGAIQFVVPYIKEYVELVWDNKVGTGLGVQVKKLIEEQPE